MLQAVSLRHSGMGDTEPLIADMYAALLAWIYAEQLAYCMHANAVVHMLTE
jgi:hypothetical protein